MKYLSSITNVNKKIMVEINKFEQEASEFKVNACFNSDNLRNWS